MKNKCARGLSLPLMFLTGSVLGQHADHAAPGRDARTAADTLILGSIDFHTSASGEAERAFITGVMALHSFWYPEAIDHFRRARELDPGYAMAYWGEAMAYDHVLWFELEREKGAEVLAALDARIAAGDVEWTEREKGYVDAIRLIYDAAVPDAARRQEYADAMVDLAARYPEDDEATVFAVLARMAVAGRDPENPRDVVPLAARLEEIYQRNPDHPGAVHYLIHLYDSPAFAQMGLRPARVYARIAPASSHALHMPSHIFSELGMWDEMVASNEASYRASADWQERTGRPLSARDWHAFDWMLTAYMNLGRYADARRLLADMDAVVAAGEGADDHAALVAHAVGFDGVYWFGAQVAGLDHAVEFPSDFDVAKVPQDNATFYVAGAAAIAGNDAVYDALVGRMRAMLGMPGMEAYRNALEANLSALEATRLQARGDLSAARDAARKAMELERADDPNALSSATGAYAELLVVTGAPAEAAPLFDALMVRYPRRPIYLLGAARARAALGERDAAAAHYAELARVWAAADEDLPALREARAFLGD